MKSFNLTEWALKHRAVMVFLILVIAVAVGSASLGSDSSKIPSSPCRR